MPTLTEFQDVSPVFPDAALALQHGNRLLVVMDSDTFGPDTVDRFAVYQLDGDGLPDDTKPTLYAGSDWQAACKAMEEAQ